MSYERAFAGLRIIDLSQGVAGPYCAMLAAQHGAEVIKVEPPSGDWSRGIGERFGDQSALAVAANRGKRSIVVDLKVPAGLELVRRLTASADIFIESFRPGVAERLGLGYDVVRAENAGLLYLSVSGYGQSGPYAKRPLTDTVAQAFSGLMSANLGNDGEPHRVGLIIVDLVTALYAYQALSTALYARREAVEGRYIDVSLMQAAAALQAAKFVSHALEDGEPLAPNAPAGNYQAKDGRIVVTLVKEEQFRRMAEVLDLSHLVDDPRYIDFRARARNMDTLGPLIEGALAKRTVADWQARFDAADVLCQPINDYGAWLQDPHVQAVGAAPIVTQTGVGEIPTPLIPGVAPLDGDESRSQAPAMGADGRAILKDFGLSKQEIFQLVEVGAVRLDGDKDGVCAA